MGLTAIVILKAHYSVNIETFLLQRSSVQIFETDIFSATSTKDLRPAQLVPHPMAVSNEPFLKLDDDDNITAFLHKELACPTIDEMEPIFHYVARKSGSHISPLHEQVMKGRTLRITEDPGMHLIWYYNIFYVKPIPLCLFSERFLDRHVNYSRRNFNVSTCRNALGFLRSYGFLVRHESDFRLAQENHLIPNGMVYEEFQTYIERFRGIPDAALSPRWQLGQIRLTRLNWAVRLYSLPSRKGQGFSRRMYYQEIYWQTGQYVESFVPPILFIFAAISLMLSAMQVILASNSQDNQSAMLRFCWVFSFVVIALIAAVMMGIIFLIASIILAQLHFALATERKASNIR
jgi:hypothetical protein